MGINESCLKHGELTDYTRRLAPSASSSSFSSDEETEFPVFCGSGKVQRFHWVPARGWDGHARSLGISARNTLLWDGSSPVPTAPPGNVAWLLPCSDKLSLRIAKLREKLKRAGWKIISSPVHVIQNLGNKANLPMYAAKIGMTAFLPQHFLTPENALYPCVLKPSKGEYGKDSYICNSKNEVYECAPSFSAAKWVLQELVPGHVEWSVSMLVSNGSILDVVGMRYTYDRAAYIWPNVVEVCRELSDVPETHVATMARFLVEYDGILNFNYKQRPDGRICIFEVNTRIGADLGCDAPRERARQLFQRLEKLPR